MQQVRHPALVTASVMLASMLYSMDWTIAAVALPHMQGAFSATQDQISWIITSYIVASAIMIPTAGWLSTRFGRKRVFVTAVALFTGASVLCGAATSLPMEVIARILQGMGGAFLIPLSHSIILDTYPPEQHGKAMALWGTGSVFGTVLGPPVGGFVTEYLSWQWIFYINVPLGLIALVGAVLFLPETERDRSKRLDWFGFVTLAVGVGALQMMLDRGERQDWFASTEIMVEAGLAALGMYLFVAHILTTRNPFLDPRLIAQRRFFLSLLFISFYGFLSVPPMVLMPTFLENLRGYTIESIGVLQMPRGVGMLLALVLSGRISGKIDPRIMIAFGLGCLMVASGEMSRWTAEVGEWPILWTGFMQGWGAGIMLVPIQVISFPTLAPNQRTEAASVFNLWRSVCSSAGISLTLTLLLGTAAGTRARLVEHATPYNDALGQGEEGDIWNLGSEESIAVLAREIDRQASVAGYNEAFLFLALAALAAMPLLLFVGRPPKTAEKGGGTAVVAE